MKINLFLAVTTAVLFLQQVNAQVMEDHRCERDSLNINEANLRLDWAVNNHIKDAYGIGWTAEFANVYRNIYNQHPVLKGRPVYPTYGVPANSSQTVWTYPNNWRAYPLGGGITKQLPEGYIQSAMCTASCYKPQMRILATKGFIDILSAKNLNLNEIIVLDYKSTLNKLVFTKVNVASYTVSMEDYNHDILIITLNNGATLKVTPDHTFIDANGDIKTAKEFNKSEKIIDMNGQKITINDIKSEKYFGKVYNVTPKSQEAKNHILIAEGFLTGSAYYQNVELNDANRHLLRRNISPDIIK